MSLGGVDISDVQPSFDFGAYASAGHRLAIVKATEGLEFVAETFARIRDAMRDSGLMNRCFYHYARPQPGRTGAQDAAYLLATLENLEPGEGVALDLEERHEGLSPRELKDFALDFVDAVESASRDAVPAMPRGHRRGPPVPPLDLAMQCPAMGIQPPGCTPVAQTSHHEPTRVGRLVSQIPRKRRSEALRR